MSKMQVNHINLFEDKNCKVIEPLIIPNKKTKVKYICECGFTFVKTVSDFMRRGCKKCGTKILHEIPDEPEYTIPETGEIWKPIMGGWISSFGRAQNSRKIFLTLDKTKNRYFIAGQHQYASRLVAFAFKIEGYEKLDVQNYVVSHKDKKILNNRLDNLHIISKSDMGKINGGHSRQSDTFKKKITWKVDKFADLEWKIVPELPNHVIHINGEIWNGKRFLTFTNCEGYFQFGTLDKSYKVHRLVCYAFHPIPEKKLFSDYQDMQVNHKDGNKMNNHADNLEWMTQNENQDHAYATGLKKGVSIIQLSKEKEELKEFCSIAQAVRETQETSYQISRSIKGFSTPNSKFLWKLKT